MKRILSATCLLLALPAAAGAVTLGSDVWPPFTDEPGRTRIALDLVEEALDRAGYAGETVVLEFGEVMERLRAGDLDGSAALWRDAERERFLEFSRPYLENRLVLVGRKGADVSAARLSELAGRKVAVVAGYAYGVDMSGRTGPEFVTGPDDQSNLTLLLSGAVDYMLVDDLLIAHVLQDQGREARERLEIGTTPLVRRALHFALRRDLRGATTVLAKFDAAVRTMIADGTYNRILDLDWIRADVDGDGRVELVPRGLAAGTDAPADGYDVTAPGDDASGEEEAPRYWIDGRAYASWDEVPERYKYKAPADPAEDPGMNLYRFKF